jgi:hypothetical protein
MRVGGKPTLGVGVFFIGFALAGAVLSLPGAGGSKSPLLYICIVGGLFVCIPAILGIAIVYEYLHDRSRGQSAKHR